MAGEKIQRISHSFPYRSRVALLWLAFVLRRWHPGAEFPVQVQNWDSPRGRNESGRSLRASLCDAQSRCGSPAMPSHVVVWAPAATTRRIPGGTLGASLVRAIPKLGAGQQVQIPVLGSRAELSFSCLSKVSSYRSAEQCPDQTKCSTTWKPAQRLSHLGSTIRRSSQSLPEQAGSFSTWRLC
jgi:hypothetical protein